MSLVQITETIFVNPAVISMIEIKMIKDKPTAQIHFDSKVKISTRNPKELIKDIQNAEINQWEQFRRN